MGPVDETVDDEYRSSPPSRGLTATALLLAAVAVGCGGGGPVRQLSDQMPLTSTGVGQVLGTPGTNPVTTAAPPVVAPGARGG
ncbi:MAG: hypothetical protein GEV08_16870, partial [Acidimicrobiia bacterium]|nr:hypothetical protein [Acidimicrobiia bacterium]